jgi:molybdopterin molybdotransferase
VDIRSDGIISRSHLVSAGEALRRAQELAPRARAEWVPLAGLAGRRLAAPLATRLDLPSGHCSAMDGWAVHAAGLFGPLRVVGESAAGRPFAPGLSSGEACRISTGALLPDGADAVVRHEDGHEEGGRLVVAVRPRPWAHVRRRGEDLRCGQMALDAGVAVAAHEVAVVAAAGHAGAFCRRRLRIALLTTGDELVTPGGMMPPNAVIESNLVGLVAQAEAAGAIVCASAHAPDDRTATLTTLSALLREGLEAVPDILVTVGGVSVGAHDHVGPALEALGARWALRGVAMRPGHPVGVAVRGSTVVLALPGNPAAAAVCFHLVGRALLGVREDWSHSAPLLAPVPRHERATVFVRCTEEAGGLVPLEHQGSAQLSSLAGARVLAWIEPGTGVAPPGHPVLASRMP